MSKKYSQIENRRSTGGKSRGWFGTGVPVAVWRRIIGREGKEEALMRRRKQHKKLCRTEKQDEWGK